ncbi:MAG: methyltransferase domain-containing protein [Gammaproteobacteria bacterium]|nr:methyltransferase domain-containing protein [Gammaproteobacteria bacterium]
MLSLRCPVCRKSLLHADARLLCESGHSFDRAKEGYYNLMLAHKKKSRHPGDSKEMLISRRRFLENGYYDKLVENIAQELSKGNDSVNSVLDIGCGEGYFTRRVNMLLPGTQLTGIDISKDAVRMAAKRSANEQYIVASSSDLPFTDEQFSFVYSINSPTNSAEILRVLQNNGCFLRITSAAEHLIELKELIYETPRPHKDAAPDFPGLELKSSSVWQWEMVVENAFIFDLLKMTPYYWHASEQRQQRVKELKLLNTTVVFGVEQYSKAV